MLSSACPSLKAGWPGLGWRKPEQLPTAMQPSSTSQSVYREGTERSFDSLGMMCLVFPVKIGIVSYLLSSQHR